MRLLNLLIIILILTSSSVLASQTVNNYQNLNLKQTIESTIKIIPTSSSYSLTYFYAKLNLFPRNESHQLLKNEILYPEVQFDKTEDLRIITWNYNVVSQNMSFKLTSLLDMKINRPKISKKVSFPIQNLPFEFNKYLKFTQTIDTNDKIKRKAQELAQQKDDLFEIEYSLANFVNNYLTYSIDSYIADTNHPSSWVYNSKNGACDEYTNLFISLNRELGIPARFVSGIAYTDSELFDVKWGNHAWAEVYFPEFGWVPFDVTYGQLGYVDPTHIIMEKDIDGETPSVIFQGKGVDYGFETTELNFTTEVISMGLAREDLTKIDVSVQESKVGFNSYNLIKAEIRNPLNQYVVQRLSLGQTNNLKILGDSEKFILLKPFEKKVIYWLVHLEDKLQKGFYYTFPVRVITETGNQISSEFEVYQDEEIFSEEYMKQFIQEENAQLMQRLDVECEDKFILQKDISNLTCTIKINPDFSNINSVKYCISSTCSQLYFDSNTDSKSINLPINTEELGVQTLKMLIESSEFQEDHFITYRVNDVSYFKITNFDYPDAIKYDQVSTLSFSANKVSFTNIDNLTLKIKHPNFENSWNFETFNQSQTLEIDLKGKNLNAGLNELVLVSSYIDSKNNLIVEEYPFEIRLVDLNMMQRLGLFFNAIGNKTIKLTRYLATNIFNKEDLNEDQIQVYSMIVLSLILILGFIIVSYSLSLFLRLKKHKSKLDKILNEK